MNLLQNFDLAIIMKYLYGGRRANPLILSQWRERRMGVI